MVDSYNVGLDSDNAYKVKDPYVSIIVPVRNGEKNIENCIKSINCLDYPKERFELIIIDNGSTDKTVKIIENFQFEDNMKLYFEERKGVYKARNLGVRNAKGEIIIFTDADCIVDSNWVKNIVEYFSDKSVGGVAGEIFPKKGNSIVERYALSIGMWSQKSMFNTDRLPFAQAGNVAYRRDVFSKIGYFADILSGGDADYSWRMLLETNYKLVYAGNAVVIHDHKIDLKGLFKQTFRYGSSNVFLKQKYGERCEKITELHKKSYSKITDNIFNIIYYLFKNRNDLMLIFPALVFKFGFNSGKIYTKYIKRSWQ
jgi:cellulose synthase/poly-beta-1,6-N-acetylglucosamine synthase-like glycosyltransferase